MIGSSEILNLRCGCGESSSSNMNDRLASSLFGFSGDGIVSVGGQSGSSVAVVVLEMLSGLSADKD